MRKLKLYLDSSVIGWSLNRANPSYFAEANLLLRQIADGKFIGSYSWLIEQEVNAAPRSIADKLYQKINSAKLKKISTRLKSKVENLAKVYCDKKIVPADCKNDAIHIAIATYWKADALVSYNFQHIVNLETMIEVNKINRSFGLNEIFLCQPQEVIITNDK